MDWKLQGVFGKPVYKSLTAWGCVLWAGVPTMVNAACAAGLISEATCGPLKYAVENAGAVLTVIGLRRSPLEIAKALSSLQQAGVH